ncbi:copper chaperone PCu(A)C [Streptacidiphilus sp. EB129]|uniref:copper chaperone PCu(A)C n=1 Tax=Streptacidiphilus sp. EB129 TaxID=3156262 RepID=UPI0035154BBA
MRRAALAGALGAVLLGAAGVAGCGAGHGTAAGAAGTTAPPLIAVTGAYIPLPASPDMAAAYFALANTGGSDDALVGVSSPNAQSAELNESTATSMDAISEVAVPAHGSALLARGGKHIMLMGLKPAPAVGQTVDLRLTFRKSGTITVHATVEPLTYQPPR